MIDDKTQGRLPTDIKLRTHVFRIFFCCKRASRDAAKPPTTICAGLTVHESAGAHSFLTAAGTPPVTSVANRTNTKTASYMTMKGTWVPPFDGSFSVSASVSRKSVKTVEPTKPARSSAVHTKNEVKTVVPTKANWAKIHMYVKRSGVRSPCYGAPSSRKAQ